MSALEIPWRELSAEALQGVIEEFVTREGTEYGLREVALATKVADVRRQLERGEVVLFFDADSASCQLLRREEAARRGGDGPLDTRGLFCPEPVMLLHGRVRAMQAGEELTVLATDPSTQRDIARFCEFLGHALLASEQRGEEFVFRIRKGG